MKLSINAVETPKKVIIPPAEIAENTADDFFCQISPIINFKQITPIIEHICGNAYVIVPFIT